MRVTSTCVSWREMECDLWDFFATWLADSRPTERQSGIIQWVWWRDASVTRLTDSRLTERADSRRIKLGEIAVATPVSQDGGGW